MKLTKTARTVTEGQLAATFTRRSLFLGGAQFAVGGIIAARMAWLSIHENERYAVLAEDNRVQTILVPPRRGWLVDRAGQPIAINRSDFRVDLIPQQVQEPERIVATLADLLRLPPDEVERIAKELASKRGFQPVPVAESIPYELYAAVNVRLPELAGVQPSRGFSRFYPEGAAVGHLVGYVGAPSKAEYERDGDPLYLAPGFKIGKEGLEKTLEKNLRGVPGAQRIEVTARGKLVRELTDKPDRSGKPVKLTLDAGLQAYASRRLGRESGSVVVIDCHSGDLLAMTSMPSYDPNSFSDGIGQSEWKMMSDDERKPLLNKTLNSLYPPGSTLKPMMALALQRGGIDPDQTVFCGGGYQLGNRFFRCLGRHGSVNMHRAIAKSCNSYFYAMSRRIGIDRMAEMARMLTLGSKYDLPVVSQSYGTYPDSAWKARKYKDRWRDSDTLNAAIGQGYVILNPMQLAVMTARIASGRALEPRLILDGRAAPQPLPIPAEHLEAARKGMWEVVNGDGTAGRSRLEVPNVAMGGKTGTAQVRRIMGGQRGQSGAWRYRDHGLFVFFAPTDQPRYAGAVVIEHGMGGSRAAAPVAKDVLTFLFDRERAMASLLELEKGWGGTIAERMAADAAAWRRANGVPETQVA